jgi:hypothetical protein
VFANMLASFGITDFQWKKRSEYTQNMVKEARADLPNPENVPVAEIVTAANIAAGVKMPRGERPPQRTPSSSPQPPADRSSLCLRPRRAAAAPQTTSVLMPADSRAGFFPGIMTKLGAQTTKIKDLVQRNIVRPLAHLGSPCPRRERFCLARTRSPAAHLPVKPTNGTFC